MKNKYILKQTLSLIQNQFNGICIYLKLKIPNCNIKKFVYKINYILQKKVYGIFFYSILVPTQNKKLFLELFICIQNLFNNIKNIRNGLNFYLKKYWSKGNIFFYLKKINKSIKVWQYWYKKLNYKHHLYFIGSNRTTENYTAELFTFYWYENLFLCLQKKFKKKISYKFIGDLNTCKFKWYWSCKLLSFDTQWITENSKKGKKNFVKIHNLFLLWLQEKNYYIDKTFLL